MLTGATGGLGRAIAKGLRTRARRSSSAAGVRRTCWRSPSACPAPITASSSPTSPRTARRSGWPTAAAGVDILVANAGLPGAGWLSEFSAEEVKRALRVNLEAPMLLARALFPAMLEGGSGALVFVSSLSGKSASPRSCVYNATKFGLRGFALGLRTDLGPRGIGVSLVSPGFVREAGMFADAGAKTPPLMGTTTPAAVADAVAPRDRRRQGRDRRRAALRPGRRPRRMVSPRISVLAQSGSVGQQRRRGRRRRPTRRTSVERPLPYPSPKGSSHA